MTDHTERRAIDRADVNAVIGIDSCDRKNRVGVTRNISDGGALFHSPSRFTPGETLCLFISEPSRQGTRSVTARVVRTDTDPPERGSSFPNLTAVVFEAAA